MPDAAIDRPAVAAITFHERGGGIAAVSRLAVDALRASGHAPSRLALAEGPGGCGFQTTTAERMRFGLRLAAAQAARRCDWVLFTHLSLALVQRVVPAALRRPHAVFLHDVEAWEPLSPARTEVLTTAFVRLANSRYTARRVAEAHPGVGPVLACPLALPAEWAASAASRPASAHRPPIVLIVGRMMAAERYKGHDQLLDAWPGVVADVPDAVLVCVGEGDDVPRLRERAASLGLDGSVRFPGFVDEAERRAWYDRAAVFAMPSRREGFGLVYLEAMAAGLPCIGSTHDAASEIVQADESGYLVDQDDVRGLAARIVTLLKNEDRRRAMGEAGRARVLSDFTFPAFTRRLTEALASVGRSHGPVAAGVAPAGRDPA